MRHQSHELGLEAIELLEVLVQPIQIADHVLKLLRSGLDLLLQIPVERLQVPTGRSHLVERPVERLFPLLDPRQIVGDRGQQGSRSPLIVNGAEGEVHREGRGVESPECALAGPALVDGFIDDILNGPVGQDEFGQMQIVIDPRIDVQVSDESRVPQDQSAIRPCHECHVGRGIHQSRELAELDLTGNGPLARDQEKTEQNGCGHPHSVEFPTQPPIQGGRTDDKVGETDRQNRLQPAAKAALPAWSKTDR